MSLATLLAFVCPMMQHPIHFGHLISMHLDIRCTTTSANSAKKHLGMWKYVTTLTPTMSCGA